MTGRGNDAVGASRHEGCLFVGRSTNANPTGPEARQTADARPEELAQPETTMLKGIAKAVAYYKAPMRTFAVLHPFKALKWAAIFFVVSSLLRRPPRDRREIPAG